MHNFKKIKAWEEAIELAVMIYEITNTFPDVERFGLISQLRRCSVSISSNIAEGAGRDSKPQFVQFLGIANASANELKSQLILANRINFLTNEDLSRLEDSTDKVQRMITNFIKQL